MLKLLNKLPYSCRVAVSGGSDSMAAIDFLRRTRPVSAIHVIYGQDDKATNIVLSYCHKYNIKVYTYCLNDICPKGISKEQYWRESRYKIFTALNAPIVTAHNLDDCVENWIMGACTGQPKLIPYRHQNVVRPFLRNRKAELKQWCLEHSVPFTEEAGSWISTRNKIRTSVIPSLEQIYPGLFATIRHKLERKYAGEL